MYRGKLKTYKLDGSIMAEPEPQRPTLFGNVLEIQFEHAGQQFWACADYYPESKGTYLVSYKVGMANSWFATAFEYGQFFDDIHIECSEDEIVGILHRNIEAKKEYAARRYLESVYKFMFFCDNPKHLGLLSGALKFIAGNSDTNGAYVPFEGIRKSVLIRTRGSLYYCGHFNDDGSHLQLFGTETDAAYIRVGDLSVSAQDDGAIEKQLYEYHEMYSYLIHPTIQTMQMDVAANAEKDNFWESAIAPYRTKEINLRPNW